ncbi:MAG TPA: twin-arginine translocation signal domain-containing protein [Kofleriaceae bacterium]|nr:twin-arginine translocation signal domain-containing protein [Kofleriaceae bacterium]
MALSRRNLLKGLGAVAAATTLSPLIRVKRASAAGNGKRVVIVGIGGGLRLRESLGMGEGATFPNLFGTTPLVTGFATGSQGAPRIAPEYAATAQPLALPAPRATPLHTLGTLVTNLRYADGPPGHLQGHGCLLSGFYNQLENRADAHLPVPTIFELHRRATNAPATDAWYVSMVGGFYRALITSDNPGYGPKYAGVYLQPPGAMQPLVPILTSGKRTIDVQPGALPTIPRNAAEDAAVDRLTKILDGNSPPFSPTDPIVHLADEDNARIQNHLAEIYSDGTYQSFFADSFGIGLRKTDGTIDGTNDAKTIYHAERVLSKFKPAVMAITLLDIDVCHMDFNGYLRSQQLADAMVTHLWNFIQADTELKDTTTLIIMPEHGRHLFFNGNNPDSLGRSGIDHGQGDNGDRDVWMLALGPDIKPNQVIAPTGIVQSGRTSGRYETIDSIMTAMSVLGHETAMKDALVGENARPGLLMQEVMA